MVRGKDTNEDSNKSLLMNLFQGISDAIFGGCGYANVNIGNDNGGVNVNSGNDKDNRIGPIIIFFCCCSGNGSGHLIDESEIIL